MVHICEPRINVNWLVVRDFRVGRVGYMHEGWADWHAVERKAHVHECRGIRDCIWDDEERIDGRARERYEHGPRRAAHVVGGVMPGAEEYLVDVYASLRSNGATGATRALIPHICGVVCRLGSSNDISKLIIDSAIDGERADWGQGEEMHKVECSE